ncbi:MAG: DedA family protein [Bacteriovorax sp.]|nr:DedA family protein [Bacteriovorax sp.]
MDILHTIIDYLLHFEVHLDYVISNYHTWTYLFLFIILFVETGLVIMPFLPGDSLLFAVGAFAARGSFDFWSICVTLFLAAVLGDTVNYSIGKFFGPKIFAKKNHKLLNVQHLEKAHAFYAKYGAKTIILARFIPIVRTFAPFVAGIGNMAYKKFMSYNIIGGALWIFSFIPLGYFFGNLPIIQSNFKFAMLGIIFISVAPGVIEFIREKQKNKKIA